ncbi:MAG: hypothetical protein ACKO04_03795, partial [Actinomycetes bacterium]
VASQGVEVDKGSVPASRRDQVVVLCVAGAVLVERLGAALWVGPARRVLDNDEAVYFTAAALMGRGSVLYRDVTVAQPPGLAAVLALPSRWLPVLDAIAVGRCLAALAGAGSIVLVGRLALRRYSVGPAVAAMVVMALFPAAALSDRSLLVEPWLNLCTAAAAVWWLGDGRSTLDVRRGTLGAGVALGAAATFKWWAGMLVLPMALTLDGRPRAELARTVGVGAATTTLLLLPVLLLAPSDFFQQAVRYQWGRSDGAAVGERLGPLLGAGTDPLAVRHLLPTLVAAAALVLLSRSVGPAGRDPVLRFGLVWYGLLVGAFLLGPYLGFHYTAHLSPALGLMAAPVAQWVLVGRRSARPSVRSVALLLGVAVLVVLSMDLRWVYGDAVAHDPAPVGVEVRARTEDGAVHAPSPDVVLRAGRVPGVDRAGRVRFDPLAASAPGDYRRPRDEPPPLPDRADLVVLGPIDDVAPAQLLADGFLLVEADPSSAITVWERRP